MRWASLLLAAVAVRPASTWLPVPSVVLHQQPRRTPSVYMAKGDGKQRRKKKEDLPPPPPPSAQQPSAAKQQPKAKQPQQKAPASRVDKDQLLSVRKQIALAKAYKAYQEQASRPQNKVRTSFRKKVKGPDPNAGVDYTPKESEEEASEFAFGELPLLFVDGYNVIGLWPRLKKRREKNDMDGARRLLLDDLVEFCPRRFDVICVFDAPGAGESKDKEDEHYGVRVVYACTSADEYIERETRRLQGERNAWVSTNDNAVQVASRAHGANVVTANWLVRELKGSRQATGAVLEEFNERQFRNAGGRSTLWDSLDSETRAELEARFRPDPMRSLSRKNREAFEQMERMKAAGQLQGRKAAIPPRRSRKPKPPAGSTSTSNAADGVGEAQADKGVQGADN